MRAARTRVAAVAVVRATEWKEALIRRVHDRQILFCVGNVVGAAVSVAFECLHYTSVDSYSDSSAASSNEILNPMLRAVTALHRKVACRLPTCCRQSRICNSRSFSVQPHASRENPHVKQSTSVPYLLKHDRNGQRTKAELRSM